MQGDNATLRICREKKLLHKMRVILKKLSKMKLTIFGELKCIGFHLSLKTNRLYENMSIVAM